MACTWYTGRTHTGVRRHTCALIKLNSAHLKHKIMDITPLTTKKDEEQKVRVRWLRMVVENDSRSTVAIHNYTVPYSNSRAPVPSEQTAFLASVDQHTCILCDIKFNSYGAYVLHACAAFTKTPREW